MFARLLSLRALALAPTLASCLSPPRATRVGVLRAPATRLPARGGAGDDDGGATTTTTTSAPLPAECDYLVVGGGATGIAFADSLLAAHRGDAACRVVVADLHRSPGGQWWLWLHVWS